MLNEAGTSKLNEGEMVESKGQTCFLVALSKALLVQKGGRDRRVEAGEVRLLFALLGQSSWSFPVTRATSGQHWQGA